MSQPPIQAIGAVEGANALGPSTPTHVGLHAAPAMSFSQMLTNGIDQVDQKLINADTMVKTFAVDNSVPLHQVTYALEQARLSFELMLQIRTKLVDAYQEFSRMQL